jgi:hypothetical protein
MVERVALDTTALIGRGVYPGAYLENPLDS